jgi:sigma-B regulation protein RsbU (phosphoserine phosphatase)
LQEAEYKEKTVQLSAGDRLVFYTDGIVEAANPKGEFFGFDRLLQVVREARNLNADELLKEITTQVHEFCGGAAQSDDLTLIVVSL